MKRLDSKKARKSPGQQGRREIKKGLFRKRTLAVLALLLVVMVSVIGGLRLYRMSARFFHVTEIVFFGNVHLSDGDLKALIGAIENESLLRLSTKEISTRLLKSPWIKDVCVRKDFPHGISIRVHESSPFAILEMKGRSFLVDEKGKMLEEMKGAVPFLPVITADPFKNRDIFMEAISLARVLKEKKIATERNRVEIVADKVAESISVVIDNVIVKVGQGNYEQKLSRLFELEDEIKKRAIAVDYVDLRFANRVVLKPINEVVR